MSETSNLPAQIAEALVAIPKGLTPGVIKALDRLVTATVDIPVAWLNQKKARIDAQTESYKAVEASIASSVATGAGSDPEIAQRAIDILVRKEYRKQVNREAVAAAMVEDIREHPDALAGNSANTLSDGELEDDWMNVFEKYAEDASSERLQGLWGRVLAGEIRRPGRFSARTLRFLSEFSQSDALLFEEFAKLSFGGLADRKLIEANSKGTVGHLMKLEASGLIQGATGLGFTHTITFDENGNAFFKEDNQYVILVGGAGVKIAFKAIMLTTLGQELLSLLAGRNASDAAKTFAHSIRTPLMQKAYLGSVLDPSQPSRVGFTETLWLDTDEQPNSS